MQKTITSFVMVAVVCKTMLAAGGENLTRSEASVSQVTAPVASYSYNNAFIRCAPANTCSFKYKKAFQLFIVDQGCQYAVEISDDIAQAVTQEVLEYCNVSGRRLWIDHEVRANNLRHTFGSSANSIQSLYQLSGEKLCEIILHTIGRMLLYSYKCTAKTNNCDPATSCSSWVDHKFIHSKKRLCYLMGNDLVW